MDSFIALLNDCAKRTCSSMNLSEILEQGRRSRTDVGGVQRGGGHAEELEAKANERSPTARRQVSVWPCDASFVDASTNEE